MVEEVVFHPSQRTLQSGMDMAHASQLADYILYQSGLTVLGPVTFDQEKDLVPNVRGSYLFCRSLREEKRQR